MAAGLFAASAQAQSDGKGPYGLQHAEIKVTYTENVRGPATVELTSEEPIEGDLVLLTFSDGRRDHEVRLQRSRDGSFAGRAELPAATDLRSLRLGTGDDIGRDSFLMPQVEETRDGTLIGTREGEGWKIGIEINRSGSGTIITIYWPW
ncbi:hypothetical protein [Rubrivirga sp. IMCC45206]|uniref:hypothetical protein n=1 Tax=Rubrivirga sp. IMCC45206 TaxID=3391614 RepID=UPI00398FC335